MSEAELYNVVIMFMNHVRRDGEMRAFSYNEVSYIRELLNKIKAKSEEEENELNRVKAELNRVKNELNQVKTELKEMEERKMEKELVWTNEDAIKMLKSKMDGSVDTSYEWVETVRLAINAIEALKTQPKWIPVEERLPEEHECDDGYIEPSERVLVQLSNGSMKVSRYWGRVIDEPWMDLSYPTTLSVVAWMPLPQPYKSESEDKE